MAVELPGFMIPGLKVASSVDLSTMQYRAVKLVDEFEVDICKTSTDIPIGITQSKSSGGESIAVMASGLTMLYSKSSVTYGENIVVGTSEGAVEAVDVTADADKYTFGKALDNAVSSGSTSSMGYISALINCQVAVSLKKS